MVGQALMLFGALLILLAGIGVVRFRDVLARMHALSKASTLGFVLVLLGGALVLLAMYLAELGPRRRVTVEPCPP